MGGNNLCPWGARGGGGGLSGGAGRGGRLFVGPRSMPRVLRIFMLPRVRGGEVVWVYCAGSEGALPGEKSSRSSLRVFESSSPGEGEKISATRTRNSCPRQVDGLASRARSRSLAL